MRLDLLVKLKYALSTIIVFVYNRYSMRDLLSGLNCLTRILAMCIRYGIWCQRFLWHQLALSAMNSMS